MPYSLNDLIIDIKDAILQESLPNGSDKICYFVSKALMDQNFISENLPDRQNGEHPRQILYEDKETGLLDRMDKEETRFFKYFKSKM